ncbi:chromatin associated protein KTI12 [Colletotrichum graminicola]|uniref:Chromatin associated protein KTI12 n=1 Tax=Colletotrichum graminicola (strain M1.001 / M2 / FGSC 10212) TaxID=645133 RepID=E3Q2V1_COLGM|nr:chromatin associated protein KTI12 [Colletotrichum graminicola M1.001]EFQ24930.1 chromatin associated protein KTI12 [Colletotrichum graminicola M1.001]WDK15529.1 chromatin associated protein KTI12 [Colletotrichum graminicola]
MPLIVVSGLPTSGKTHRAKQLQAHLASRIAAAAASSSTPAEGGKQPPYRLHYISDSTLSIPRDVYDLDPQKVRAHTRSANASEKDARAAVYGAVKRVLSDRDIVILDGLNYIKGWRYQLHCEAKAVKTPSVVLQIGCGVDRARGINEERLRKRRRRRRSEGEGAPTATAAATAMTTTTAPAITTTTTTTGTAEDPATNDRTTTDAGGGEEEEEPYEPDNWENLVLRYEEPNPMTRWDSPLFTLIWDDDAAQAARVFNDVWDAIAGTGRKAVKPNQATVQRSRDAGGDYLYVLDRETQDVVRRVLEAQGEGGEDGGEVTVPRGAAGAGAGAGAGTDEGLVVRLPGRKVGLPQLQRLRRAFVGLNRGGIGLEGVGSFSVERMRESFVGYLNDSFDQEG